MEENISGKSADNHTNNNHNKNHNNNDLDDTNNSNGGKTEITIATQFNLSEAFHASYLFEPERARGNILHLPQPCV